jgi:hypothetical protein
VGESIWYCYCCKDTFPYNNTVECPNCGSEDIESSYDKNGKRVVHTSNVKIDYTGWKFYRDIIGKYCGDDGESNYYLYDYDCRLVHSDEIVGLSFPNVLRQEKLNRLYRSIKRNGYYFDRYQDLHLVYTPDKIYTVASGGNHRPYLARMLNIKRIKAFVEILIPKDMLTQEELNECERILNEMEFNVNTDHPYFYELCKKYDLIPSEIKIRIR